MHKPAVAFGPGDYSIPGSVGGLGVAGSKIMHTGPGGDLIDAGAVIIATAIVDVPPQGRGLVPAFGLHVIGHSKLVEARELLVARALVNGDRESAPAVRPSSIAQAMHLGEK